MSDSKIIPAIPRLEAHLQRPDWEPDIPGGCITVRDQQLHRIYCADAEFIVRACESHEVMLEALEAVAATEGRCLDQWEKQAFQLVREAIAKAKGGEA